MTWSGRPGDLFLHLELQVVEGCEVDVLVEQGAVNRTRPHGPS